MRLILCAKHENCKRGNLKLFYCYDILLLYKLYLSYSVQKVHHFVVSAQSMTSLSLYT